MFRPIRESTANDLSQALRILDYIFLPSFFAGLCQSQYRSSTYGAISNPTGIQSIHT